MHTIRSWFDYCADLWKGRKPIDFEAKAKELDEAMPRPDGRSWQTAVEHARTIPRNTALKHVDAHPDSPEGMSRDFWRATLRHAVNRRHSVGPILAKQSTLNEPIDHPTLKHYSMTWSNHLDRIDNVSRGALLNEEGSDAARALVSPYAKTARPQQFRSNIVARRVKYMKAQGHQSPFMTDDDLATIHVGVERAIQAGKVSTDQANRYHVMRDAVKIHRAAVRADNPELDLKTSYAAFDTGALKAMREGVEHLHEAGFTDAKHRLGPVLSSALESHSEHPFGSNAAKNVRNRTAATEYPHLHPIGSLEFQKQTSSLKAAYRRYDKVRADSSALPAPQKAPAAAPEAPAWQEPKSWSEYKDRESAGEDFEAHFKREPALRSRLEGMNPRRQKVQKAFDTAAMLDALLSWRKETA